MNSPSRWSGWLLALFPADFRRLRGDELRDEIDAGMEAARRQGPGAALSYRVRTTIDVAGSALRLRRTPPAPGRDVRTRIERGEGWTMTMFHGAGPTIRGLIRARGFTAVVLATLAIGIGMTTALFTVVDHALLRPLAYPDADRLVYLQASYTSPEIDHALISAGLVDRIRESVPELEAVEGIAFIRQNLTGTGHPAQVEVGWTSPGFLDLLGAPVVHGRLIRSDDPEGAVVLSHALWLRHFGGDAETVGRTVQLDGQPHTIVGVLAPGFELRLPTRRTIRNPELYKNPDSRWSNGDIWVDFTPNGMLRVVGRTSGDDGLARLNDQLTAVLAGVREEVATFDAVGISMRAGRLHTAVVDGVRSTLLLLLASVGLVLVIACFNVANLLLVRTEARRRELAIRKAIGSSGRRLGGLLLGESLILSLGGAVLGIALATLALQGVRLVAPPQLRWLADVDLDLRVAAFGVAAALATTLLVGLIPLRSAVVADPGEALGSGTRGASARSGRIRDVLVVAQLAFSVVLLAGAGLLSNSFLRLRAIEPGVDTEDVATFSVSVPGTRYPWPGPAANDFYREVERGVAALPEVERAAIVWPAPYTGAAWGGGFRLESEDSLATTDRNARYVLTTEHFFPTVDLPIVAGRSFAEGQPREVTLVSRSLADRMFPGESAVGRTLVMSPWGGQVPYEIIGVVEDTRWSDLRGDVELIAYFDTRSWSWVDWEVDVVAKTTAGVGPIGPRLREVLAGLDPEVPVAELDRLDRLVAAQTSTLRFALALVGGFAAVAALLALIGLYGVVSWTVNRQRREIGIRMALGSAAGDVLRRVVGRGARLTAIGVAAGLGLAVVLSGVVEAYLFEVEGTDPVTLIAVGAVLGVASLLATGIPARAAARLDPVVTLRSE